MRRRTFLASGVAAAALGAGAYVRLEHLPVTIDYPGRSAGHAFRDQVRAGTRSASSSVKNAGVVIIGSGIAALTAAWKLAKEGVSDVTLLLGPEQYGNAASHRAHGLAYPTGAHYLPLPSMESMHMREMLWDFGIILSDPFDERPTYDERYVLHAPGDRVLFNGVWQDGYLPSEGVPLAERDQHRRFFKMIEQFADAKGADGRRGFTVPIELASQDARFLALDRVDFASWLDAQGLMAPTLRWYLNYCCRDDYGRNASECSAYAGIHYFAARGGEARNAERGAVLTFPEGLGRLAETLFSSARRHAMQIESAMAVKVQQDGARVRVSCLGLDGAQAGASFDLLARAVIVATPLYVAQYLVGGIDALGFDSARHLPRYAPWMVSNFIMRDFPEEAPGVPLAWDNVQYGNADLGYVVSTHQQIRQSQPKRTAFSAYCALSDMDPVAARHWLDSASAQQLLARASTDLRAAYGFRLGPCVESVEITVRGHAMATPSAGYRSNPGLLALRSAAGPIQFAHADLSGYSVFEEAAWWGYRAAGRISTALR